MLINYAHNYPSANLRYNASCMQLYIYLDAAYRVLPNTRSRGAGYFCLSDKLTNTTIPPLPKMNSSILTECQTLKYVTSSAAEAEVRTAHNNGKPAISIRVTLDVIRYTQDPTPLKIDNNTAEGFVNNTICKKRSKIFDMRFRWMIYRIEQK